MIEEFSGDFLQQLRGFYYVAQMGSMGQAAKVMHRSQSSVSRLIKQLEQSLGVELFSRVQKGVVLTNEGNELFAQAVSIFEHIRSIHSELGHVAKEPSGAVSMQAGHAVFIRLVAPLLPELYKACPKVRLNLLDAGSFAQLQKRLEERSIDFSIVVKETLPEHLDFTPLFKDRVVLAAPRALAAQIKEPVALEDLPAVPLINLPGGSGFSLFIEHRLPSGWLAGRQSLIAGNMYYQLNMVAAGLGVAFVSEASLRMINESQLAVFPLEHLFPLQEYGLVRLHDGYMTPQARAVVEFFKEHAR